MQSEHGVTAVGTVAFEVTAKTYTKVRRMATANAAICSVDGVLTLLPIVSGAVGRSSVECADLLLSLTGDLLASGASVPVNAISAHKPHNVEIKKNVHAKAANNLGPTTSLDSNKVRVTMPVDKVINCFVRSAVNSKAFFSRSSVFIG